MSPTPSARYRLREAWPGPAGRRGQPVHVVDWPLGQTRGATLCGRQVAEVQVHPAGTARQVRASVCRACAHAQESIRSRP